MIEQTVVAGERGEQVNDSLSVLLLLLSETIIIRVALSRKRCRVT